MPFHAALRRYAPTPPENWHAFCLNPDARTLQRSFHETRHRTHQAFQTGGGSCSAGGCRHPGHDGHRSQGIRPAERTHRTLSGRGVPGRFPAQAAGPGRGLGFTGRNDGGMPVPVGPDRQDRRRQDLRHPPRSRRADPHGRNRRSRPLTLLEKEYLMDKSDLVWTMISTLLVWLMCMPGLALFYGGLARKRHALSVMTQTLGVCALVVVLWLFYGYSLVFTEGFGGLGGWSRLGLAGLYQGGDTAPLPLLGTIPELLFALFQATFAAITCGLITGSMAERTRFGAALAFAGLWFTLGYMPIAH